MGAAGNIANTVFTKERTPYIIGAIITLIVLLVLYKKGPGWWAALLKRDLGDYGNPAPDAARQVELKQLAHDAYSSIYDSVGGPDRYSTWTKLLALNDTELKYVATFYQSGITSDPAHSLRKDVADEWSYLGEEKSKLVSRLAVMNL